MRESGSQTEESPWTDQSLTTGKGMWFNKARDKKPTVSIPALDTSLAIDVGLGSPVDVCSWPHTQSGCKHFLKKDTFTITNW